MPAQEPHCRGWLTSGVLAYCDDAQAQQLIEQSSGPLRAFLSRPESRREDWVPLDLLIEALTLADRMAGAGDEALAWPVGAFLATRDVGAVRELAARLLRPTILMSLAPSLWGTHFRNAGRVAVRGSGEREVVVRLIGVPSSRKVLCLAVGGWIEGFLGLGQRYDIRVEQVACAATGAPGCEFTASWID